MSTAVATSLPRPSSAWTSWGQWLALITMTLDHVARYAAPETWHLGWVDATVGRIAFPLFAAMVAWHGLFNTRNPLRYARRILVIGLVAQLPYMLMPRAADGLILNICFTLALSLAGSIWARQLMARLQQASSGPVRLAGEIVSGLLIWWLAGHVVEYGHLGLLMIPGYMLAMHHLHEARDSHRKFPVMLAAGMPVLVVAGLMNSSVTAKSVTAATALCVLLLAAGAHRYLRDAPLSMPRRLWLGWYPGHFAALALWLGVSGGLNVSS